jgi:hypothetical protein
LPEEEVLVEVDAAPDPSALQVAGAPIVYCWANRTIVPVAVVVMVTFAVPVAVMGPNHNSESPSLEPGLAYFSLVQVVTPPPDTALICEVVF